MNSARGPRSVLFVSLPVAIGGSPRSLLTVLGGLAGTCRRVVAAPPGSHVSEVVRRDGLAEEFISIGGVDRPRWDRLLVTWRLVVWARRHRYDLAAVHANGLPELNVATLAAVVARRPLLVWSHDPSLTRWAKLLVPLLARRRRTIFAAVSAASAAMLRRDGRVPERRIVVVPNPIDPAQVVADERPSRRDHLDVVVGYLGLAHERKGFDLLPDIVGELVGEPVRVVVYSDASWMPDVARRLRAIDDPPVELRPLASDVRMAYAACDVVVCPSRVESYGLVAAEAMLNELPVVAADVPSLHEVLGDTGLFFAQGDVPAAGDHLRRLVHDADLRADLGRRGRERAARSTGVTRVVDQLSSLYRLRSAG